MEWHLKAFNALSLQDFHDILQLRIAVFVVEQTCPYQEIDGLDPKSYHLFARDHTGRVIATSRIMAPQVHYNEASIGRIVSHPELRGSGIGKLLMQKSLEHCEQLFPNAPIKIMAQNYLEKFYHSFGFETTSGVFLEDDIPHIYMHRPASSKI